MVTKILFSYLYHLKIGFFVSKFLSLISEVNGPNQSEDWSLKTNLRNLKNLAACTCYVFCVFNNSPIYPGILHKLEIYFIFCGEKQNECWKYTISWIFLESWGIYFIFENMKILFIVYKIFMGYMKGAIKLIVNNSFCWQKGWLIIWIWLWNKNIINYSTENQPASLLLLSTRINGAQVC